MKETYYFPHDYNAIQDPKMMELLSNTGLSGIGFYWIIIEILHQQENASISKGAFDGYLKFYFSNNGDDQQVLNKIEQVLFKTELLLNNDGMVYSNRVLSNKERREELSQKRSIAGKISAEKRLKTPISTSVKQVPTSVQQGKERKGKEIKDIIYPLLEEIIQYCISNGYPASLGEKAFKSYSVADWHDSNGKKIINWKQKLQMVWFREENKIKKISIPAIKPIDV